MKLTIEIPETPHDDSLLSHALRNLLSKMNGQIIPAVRHDPGFHSDQDMIDFAKWCLANEFDGIDIAMITTWQDQLADDFSPL